MTYDQLVKNHLAEYKVSKLAITEPEFWRNGKKKYHYILPVDKRELNFLANYRNEMAIYAKNKVKLHQFFHHLNSSQAMGLNFFYPQDVEHRLPLLLKALGLPEEPVEECAFERMMGEGERTNFDFYMKLKSGREIVFEIKYTEKGFGGATSGETFDKQYKNVYQRMLAGKIRTGVDGYQALKKNYQLLRNIAYVDAGDERLLVFVCPEDNLKLHKQYQNVMNTIVDPALHKNIQMVTWESLLKRVKGQLNMDPDTPAKLKEHYREFEEKYFPV
ncbi:hypothetical protein QMA09_07680 [Planococcus sp. APC 3906]|uniref:PGN_0703 family putative restriction endonuclease n=1 Tax=Planococcus sp. APC 3906 TaxID=3035194 RepID=UPI0025B2B0D7|nr:hypothetical protein [Planococcus sp. APC 3906]MDN3450067.1 hypothetical protein [Planococcus sp. APC 3906]